MKSIFDIVKMIILKAKYIVLYAIGIILLIFGQRNFWEELQEASEQNEAKKKMLEEAFIASNRKFEVQELVYDSTKNLWKNKYPYFQTIQVGNVNFKALKRSKKTTIETNDDENASESF
ncbi:hypothetical protein [Pontibacter harenae]|uniref:hypothetical protein n=1 Tax=Pontibacter harenae TaxID=2894083 RepID=UPI001E287C17|nr:hypothetical protein [Pontibacter harenae]MCC9167732.1 hypothetical protein [Pontibacter harenae]